VVHFRQQNISLESSAATTESENALQPNYRPVVEGRFVEFIWFSDVIQFPFQQRFTGEFVVTAGSGATLSRRISFAFLVRCWIRSRTGVP